MTAQYNSKYNLSIWYPKGTLSLDGIIADLSHFVELEKKNPTFNRFANLSEADFSLIKFEDIQQIYLLRKSQYKGNPVISIFFVKSDLQYGIARIYQTLMMDTPIKVEIYKTPFECANQLKVPLEIIFPPF